MIKINLLPPSERQSTVSLARVFTVIGLCVLLTIGAIYLHGFYRIMKLEREIAASRNQLQLLSPVWQNMQQVRTLQQAIDAKNSLLIQFTKERKSWYNILATLGTVVGQEIWLTGVAAADRDGIKLTGIAKGYPELADFMRKLEQDGYFAEPALARAEFDSKIGAARFEIKVKIKGMQAQ